MVKREARKIVTARLRTPPAVAIPGPRQAGNLNDPLVLSLTS
ncbi:MAG: hypothetical protein PHC68_06590 [Syntrophorhabdaceae bacterium]|nr:hypothetical protein [Syntrophorhabdaceae bacterium]